MSALRICDKDSKLGRLIAEATAKILVTELDKHLFSNGRWNMAAAARELGVTREAIRQRVRVLGLKQERTP